MFRPVMVKYVPLNWLVSIEPDYLKLISDDLKTREMCNKALEKVPWLLHYGPVRLRTQEMCEKDVEKDPYQLGDFSDCFKTKRLCEKAVEDKPGALEYVSDHFKTEEMCEKAVEDELEALEYVPDHFKTEEMCEKLLKIIHRHWHILLVALNPKRCVKGPLKMIQAP